jgi:hypothetical protein
MKVRGGSLLYNDTLVVTEVDESFEVVAANSNNNDIAKCWLNTNGYSRFLLIASTLNIEWATVDRNYAPNISVAKTWVDQSTFVGSTSWNGGSALQGQLFTAPAGEVWYLESVSGYGGENPWDEHGPSCHIGVCASFSDWNPNNGTKLAICSSCVSSGVEHVFDITTVSGFSDGMLITPDKLYYLYFATATPAGQIHSSSGYDRHANTAAIDSSDGGATWNKPATWGAEDLRFKLYGKRFVQ